MIEPAVLKGFRDSLPCDEIPKRRLIRKLEDIFSLYGFAPIDTPALEYTSVLLGKGGGETDKQIFRFTDNGGREVALRFDLTVPFARFTAGHADELPRPFKRYHINKVWRGENPQKGRYREFYQCDFDIVGVDSAYADWEILSTMAFCFRTIFDKDDSSFRFHISHRGLFNSFLSHLGLSDRSVDILRLVDKIRKIGRAEVLSQLAQIAQEEKKAQLILSFVSPVEGESFSDTLSRLTQLAGGRCEASDRLNDIHSMLEEEGISHLFTLDASITRGLDYYTGLVYETFLTRCPSIGSVCSGGRYNNLASLYTKENLPGVGSSIGLDRLLAALEDLDSPILAQRQSADVLFVSEDKKASFAFESRLSSILREKGIKCDILPVQVKKMKSVYDYSDKNHIPLIIIWNWKAEVSLKDTASQESAVLDRNDEGRIIGEISDRIQRSSRLQA